MLEEHGLERDADGEGDGLGGDGIEAAVGLANPEAEVIGGHRNAPHQDPPSSPGLRSELGSPLQDSFQPGLTSKGTGAMGSIHKYELYCQDFVPQESHVELGSSFERASRNTFQMGTNRSESKREAARRNRIKAGQTKVKIKDEVLSRDLNTDQRALLRILEYDFLGNRHQMAKAMGFTDRGLGRYIAEGASPPFHVLEKAAELVFSTVDEIRAEVLGDIYFDGRWYHEDDPEFDERRLELIARLASRSSSSRDDGPDEVAESD